MKRWIAPMAALVVAATAIAAVTFAVAGSPFDSDGTAASESDGSGREGAGACLVGDTDCADTGAGGTCLAGDPDCADTGAGPDEPVSDSPVSIIDGMDPDECSLVHNIEACRTAAINAAVADLDGRGVAEADVTVVSAEMAEWPDSCLGVPQDGIACAEVITAGFEVVLEAGGDTFEYHTGLQGNAVQAN